MELKKYYAHDNIPPDIQAMVQLVGDQPTLESIWALMDLVWAVTGADPQKPESMAAFYSHTVWTFNGIFTETHQESLENRLQFTKKIAELEPLRIADYGGGFGALARLLAQRLPQCTIEVVEPFPSGLALTMSEEYNNVFYVPKLTGIYDVIIALDVLEHVEDPLALVHELATHINEKGKLLLANCFYPVIKCHLPVTFYLRNSFDFLLNQLGIVATEKILYGTLYVKKKTLRSPEKIKYLISASKIYFFLIEQCRAVKKAIKQLICKQ